MWSGGFLYPGGFQRAGDFEVGTIFDESVLSVRD